MHLVALRAVDPPVRRPLFDNLGGLPTVHGGGEYADERRDMRRTTVMAWPPPVVIESRSAERFDPTRFEAMVVR